MMIVQRLKEFAIYGKRRDSVHSRRAIAHEQDGFTVVELVVVMTLTLMFSTLVLTFTLDYWGSSATLMNDSETYVTRQNLGDRLREQLNRASTLINQNSIPDAHVAVVDTADVSGQHWQLIHAIPQTVAMPASGSYSPVFYYSAPSVSSARTPIMNGVSPYYDEFIIYLDGTRKQLLQRTLINPGASGDRLQTTCPATAANSSCPADKVLADDVTSVASRYFSRSGNMLDWTSVVDTQTGLYIGPDFQSVEVIELTVGLGRRATIHGTQATSNQTIVRVALRNG